MKNKELLAKIKKAAEKDKAKRRDVRYLRAMAFLVKKGFLRANQNFEKWYLGRLIITDAIWAGENLEPRILEVLPAAVLRLPKEFILNDKTPKELLNAIDALKNNKENGPRFYGIEYKKYKVWLDLPLKDKRTKPVVEKKIMKSFRLTPAAIEKLKLRQKETGLSGAEIIESLL